MYDTLFKEEEVSLISRSGGESKMQLAGCHDSYGDSPLLNEFSLCQNSL